MIRRRISLAGAVGLSWALLCSTCAAAEVSFLRDVAPVLLQRCVGCHGPTKAEGDFRVHTFEFLLKTGASESPSVSPAKPRESELLRRIMSADAAERMPQLDDALPVEEIDVVRRWIAEGARFDGRDPRSPFKSQLPPRVHPSPPVAYRAPAPVFALAFSPDGQELAVGGFHEVTVWNPQTGALLRRLGSLPERIQSLAYTKDGASLVVGGGSPGDYGELSLVDAAGTAPPRVLGTFDDLVLSAAISRDGARVAAGAADRAVRCYSLADGKLHWQSQLHFDWVTCIGFSHDDRFVATGSKDYTIKVLEAATGALFTTYNGHKRQLGKENGRFPVYSLAFSPDGPQAYSAGKGKSIRVWEPEKAQLENGSAADMESRFFKADHTQFLMHDAKRSVFKLALCGPSLFAATGDGTIKQFDLATLKPVRELNGHADWVYALDCHASSHLLASGSNDGEVRVWNTETGDLVASFLASPGLAKTR